MTKYHKELAKICHEINEQKILRQNIKINRRNGYYAIDRYNRKEGEYVGYLFCGNYKECYNFLQGIKATIYWR